MNLYSAGNSFINDKYVLTEEHLFAGKILNAVLVGLYLDVNFKWVAATPQDHVRFAGLNYVPKSESSC